MKNRTSLGLVRSFVFSPASRPLTPREAVLAHAESEMRLYFERKHTVPARMSSRFIVEPVLA